MDDFGPMDEIDDEQDFDDANDVDGHDAVRPSLPHKDALPPDLGTVTRSPPPPPQRSLVQLVARYVLRIAWDQCKAVAPVSLYLFFFLLVVLRLPDDSTPPPYGTIAGGLVVLTAGLVLFLEGLQWGLMPLGHAIGRNLPLQLRASFVLAICFVLGVGVTIAEPAISALQAIGTDAHTRTRSL
jgi:hypothetical protein